MAGAGQGTEWWRGAVIYQIYPRSFKDSSGDGIGDLPGIIEKLDYVASLGVDAIWLSPFYESPMRDFGYDVSDYRAVDPIFGTLADFDELLRQAHGRGLKVLIDLVLNHSSDRHPWFVESRDPASDKADWYVWADAEPDGSPPSNWLSVFGGPAWTWEPRRRQYYLHNFLPSQPNLNFHNAAVQDELLGVAAFWLERGVDGFRLDTVDFYFHDAALRDNPPRQPPEDPAARPQPRIPYQFQRHVYDKARPENIGFVKRLRALMDRHPGTALLGEVGSDNGMETVAEYTRGGDRLHMAYSFDLLSDHLSAAQVRDLFALLEAGGADAWACWMFSNHDVPRHISRWQDQEGEESFAVLLMALLLSLRGSACIYQGEELGLPEAEIGDEHLQDPIGRTFWPVLKGRDGSRTPMPWAAEQPNAGFSPVQPWLPVPKRHQSRAVDLQERAPGSVLNAYRRFIAWRRDHPALLTGAIRFLDTAEPLLVFERIAEDERLFAAFNLGGQTAALPVSDRPGLEALDGHGFAAKLADGEVRLPGYGAFFGRLPQRETMDR